MKLWFSDMRDVNGNFASNIKTYDDADAFKKNLISIPENERGEYLKGILGYRDKELSNIAETLSSIGGVHFYKVPFDDLKEDFYAGVYSNIYQDYSTIIDGYVRSFNAILNFAENSNDRDYFIYTYIIVFLIKNYV